MIQLVEISKKFGEFSALENINLKIKEGEVHTLLGENGAGKSTLMNILCGLYQPTDGEIMVGNCELVMDSPQKARSLGISMVHQHFMLIEAMTALENIMLCEVNEKGAFLDYSASRKRITEIKEAYDLQVDIDEKISNLSVGEQQKVEIIKALYNDVKVLILDEPTAVLTDEETQGLFKIINKLRSENRAIIFISHKLKEVKYISDKITVLRHGKTVATVNAQSYSTQELANLMVGEKLVNQAYPKTLSEDIVLVKLENVSYNKDSKHNSLNNISLDIRKGEILGVAGVDGNGQSQLAQMLTGMLSPQEGNIVYKNECANRYTIKDFIDKGVSHIPEDRNKMGLIGGLSIKDNIVLKEMNEDKFSKLKGKFLLKSKILQYAELMKNKYDIRCSSIDEETRNLSGGNQQKVILSRELERIPDFLVAMHPTRGLDIGATCFVHDNLINAKTEGCAIVVVSADIDEIIKISDRIIVMFEGEIMGEVLGADPDMDAISVMMGGKAKV